ncbi:UDP-Glycosyltransferase/glycogen phosphorylase [Earliella scabrosa]|nr:UDP-Glycosyltransferase/glycogen phosphorylase [Earliella scabrosa]
MQTPLDSSIHGADTCDDTYTGHTRPMIHLAARIVKLRPVTLTMLTTDSFYERVKIELSRSFDGNEEEYATRLRVIAAGDVVFIRSDEADQGFVSAWKTLIEERELVCTKTGVRYPPVPKPKAVILDFFSVDAFDSVKSLSGDSVKVYSWEPGSTSALFHLFGPENLGGKGNIRIKAEEQARATGRSYEEVAMEMTFGTEGKVVRIPGMPPMYDYEYYPQDFPMPKDMGSKIFPRVYETLEKSDGILLFTPESYEPEAVAAAREWFAATGRHAYTTGPLLPSGSKSAAVANEQKLSNESNEIVTFLDETLKTSGEKSLVYISFGSMLWPVKTPEKVWAFLDVLMELKLPFILSHASPMAAIPDEVKEKVKVYGKAILSPWTPQQLILDHPALGWFVAHGGHNGVTEAISAGVPQIFWPFTGDQPLNAIHYTDNLQIGYELLEVRSGHGLKPIYRTGYTPKGTIEAVKAEAREVLAKAFGEDGAQKRARLQELRKKVTSEWEEGGSSKRDVCALLDSL